MAADEHTPLLANGNGNGNGHSHYNGSSILEAEAKNSSPSWLTTLKSYLWHVENRILLMGFLITLSFSFTQVPIFYVFHLMECAIYYESHPLPDPSILPDKCLVNEIAARTATDFSVLGMSTTTCGILNLFVAGWMTKKLGPRAALACQTFVPAVRVATQILGVAAGGKAGIQIIQTTQLITLVGGPVGYILVINIIAGEVVSPARRTIVFGMLQGVLMLGQAIGYLSGGMIGDAWGIRRPFETAFFSFLFASSLIPVAIPYIAPEVMGAKAREQRGIKGFFSPLRVLVPQTIRMPSGERRKHYGVLFLCAGVFLGVIATGYAPMLVQMYATAVFGFQQGDNGYLMSGYAFARAVFLIGMFPRIVEWGRKWWVGRENRQRKSLASMSEDCARRDGCVVEVETEMPTDPAQFDAPMNSAADEEPTGSKPADETEGSGFDLFFLRWSLLVDGLLTMGAAFATQKWHIYVAAFLLPFGSGTAPATKGVIAEMCPSSQRADALNALTLVENIARLATQGFFGFVFAFLTEQGRPELTFYCNAAIAIVGMGVLLLSGFPPKGSVLVEEREEEDGECTGP